jgi:hypothetical protein
MKALKAIFAIFVSLMLFAEVFGVPFLGKNYGANVYGGQRVQTTRRRSVNAATRRKGRTYKEICRAINPAPYAFPNKVPFPSVPVC